MELMKGRTENIAVVSEQKKHSVKEFHDILRGGGGGGGGGVGAWQLSGWTCELDIITDPDVSSLKLPCRQWPKAVREQVRVELYCLHLELLHNLTHRLIESVAM